MDLQHFLHPEAAVIGPHRHDLRPRRGGFRRFASRLFYRLHRRLFEAFFTKGLNIGDEAVLRDIAQQAGVPDDVIASAWSDGRFEQRLEDYQAAARQLEVTATPTVFFSQNNRLNGALPYETFLKAARAGAEE